MSMSQTLRKAICRVLMGVLLFAQFAVASYACPGLMGRGPLQDGSAALAVVAGADAAAAAQSIAMPPGCDQMDPDAPNLCAAHCHQGLQSADTTATPAVGLGIPILLYALPLEAQLALGSGRSFPASDARLDAAPEPPHAILHCVFRI